MNRLTFRLKGITCEGDIDKSFFLKNSVITKSNLVFEGVRGLHDLQLYNKRLVDSKNSSTRLAVFNESIPELPFGLLNWNLIANCVRQEKRSSLKFDNVSFHFAFFN